MRNYRVFVVLFLLLTCVGTRKAHAIAVDGSLTDWGVTPYIDWNAENATNYSYQNNIYGAGSVVTSNNYMYDIEFGAIQRSFTGFYMAMVTSDRNVWEDMGIALNGEAGYRYGVDLSGLQNVEGGIQARNTYQVTLWNTEHGGSYPDHPFDITTGNFTGFSTFSFRTLPGQEMGDPAGSYNYVIEGFIPWSVLGLANGYTGEIGWHFAEISCMRDWMRIDAAAVPEPGTMLLFGSGLLGAALRRRRQPV